jgi:hypothetical protein
MPPLQPPLTLTPTPTPTLSPTLTLTLSPTLTLTLTLTLTPIMPPHVPPLMPLPATDTASSLAPAHAAWAMPRVAFLMTGAIAEGGIRGAQGVHQTRGARRGLESTLSTPVFRFGCLHSECVFSLRNERGCRCIRSRFLHSGVGFWGSNSE